MVAAEPYDDQQAVCLQSGRSLPFRYCRTVQQGLPCARILDCWQGHFDIRSYISDRYMPDEITRIFADAGSAIADTLDLIGRSRKSHPE